MKNIFKKVTAVLALSLTATFSSGCAFTSTESLDLTSTPEKALETYVTAVENQDISKIREYSNDVRNFSNEDYKDIFEYQKLVDYKILESEAKDSNTQSFLLETTFKDGLVTQVPVLLKKEGSEWKVSITSDTLNSPENKIIKNSEDTQEVGVATP